jgi:hypothetical protein
MGKIYSNIKWPFDNIPKKLYRDTYNLKYIINHILEKKIHDGKKIKAYDLLTSGNIHVLHKQIIDGESLHIFIESEELFNWLYDLEIKDNSFVLDFINKKKTISPLNDYVSFTDNNGLLYNLSIIIHHKNIKYESFKYIINTVGDNLYTVFHMLDSMSYLSVSWRDTDIVFPKSFYLIFNLLFYISAFKDYLIDAPPSDIYISNHYKSNEKYLLKTHPTLIEPGYTSPHFRRGHFRYLQNERYKEKRFHTVFVKSSFIHGDAKTVIEDKILN